MSLSTLLSGISESRANARTAALLRIGISIAALLVWFEEAPVLAALHDPAVVHVSYGLQLPSMVLSALAAVWLVTTVSLGIGFATTFAAWALAAVLAVTLLYDQQLYSNHLYLLLIVVMLISATDSGAALSLDARGRRTPETVAGWPIRLIAIQVSIVYLFAALSKLNATYLSGTVVGAYLRDRGPLAVPAEWRSLELLLILSVLSIMLEAFLAIALWLPHWRRTAFVAGLGMHGSIAVWLEPTSQLITFGVLMLPLYLAILDPAPRSIAVVWDDQCSFCRRWITWAVRFDWLHALRLVPGSDAVARERFGVSEQEALYALQVVANGRHTGGYDGVVRMADALPISFLWAPLLRLPPIATVGRRIYRRVADSRSCGLHDHGPHLHASEAGAADVSV